MGRTTIALSHDTKDRLAALGSKGETYEEIVVRLIEGAGHVEPEARTPRPPRL